MYSTRQ